MRLIDADALLEALSKYDSDYFKYIKNLITNAPTVHPESCIEELIEIKRQRDHWQNECGKYANDEYEARQKTLDLQKQLFDVKNEKDFLKSQLSTFISEFHKVQCEGWVSVPIEPTKEMLNQAANMQFSLDVIDSKKLRALRIYKAMLSAAPKE